MYTYNQLLEQLLSDNQITIADLEKESLHSYFKKLKLSSSKRTIINDDLNLIEKCLTISTLSHGLTKRKNSDLLYIIHPIDVLNIIIQLDNDFNLDIKDNDFLNVISAALLHDTIEDTSLAKYKDILPHILNDNIVKYVMDVTNPIFQDNLKRNDKLKIVCDKLSKLLPISQYIKFADIVSNSKTLHKLNPSFANIYIKEQTEKVKSLQLISNDIKLIFEKIVKEQEVKIRLLKDLKINKKTF